MDNKKAYTPKEVVGIIRTYSELKAQYSLFIKAGYNRDVNKTSEEHIAIRDLVSRTYEQLIQVKKNIPRNIRNIFKEDIINDFERVLLDEINRRKLLIESSMVRESLTKVKKSIIKIIENP